MRSPRLKLDGTAAVYHCMSRLVAGVSPFTPSEMEQLRKWIWRLAEFCGVDLITYCILNNHFHLLVRVPGPAQIDDKELLRRAQWLYKPQDCFRISLEADFEANGGALSPQLRQRLRARMHDISMYLKELKQRFTRSFNLRQQRFGTLWAERFKSVLVEDQPQAVLKVAAYIDLNAIRAGLAKDPKDYRFCGYAEAVAGHKQARKGLSKYLCGTTWKEQQENYRVYLFGSSGTAGHSKKAILTAEEIRAQVDRGGQLPLPVLFRLKVRYMSDGVILGSRSFLEEMFRKFRGHFSSHRQSGARPMRGADWGGLMVLRALRRQVFG